MISLIISSCNKEYFAALEQNISKTIGVEYEIIKVENQGKMGICEAYNRGAQKAKFDMLCFAHEDIQFKTAVWGSKVLEIFKTHPEIGLLGTAGNVYKSLTPSHWSFPGADNNSFFVNVLQGNPDLPQPDLFYSNPTNVVLQQVAAIDGFWFCAPKKVVMEFPFDEETCAGFHGYDVDFSLSVQKKYKVAVTFEILIQHNSIGDFNKEWIDAIIRVHKKWKTKLPVMVESFEEFNQRNEEKKALSFFSKTMFDNHYSISAVLALYRFRNKNFKFLMKEFGTVLYSQIRSKYALTKKNYMRKVSNKLNWRSTKV